MPRNLNPETLLKEVRRDQQLWAKLAWYEDVLEIGGAFLTTLFFLYQGLRNATWTPLQLPGWDFLLLALACLGTGIFRMANRISQRRNLTKPNDTLKACLEASLNEVNQDIWRQRNMVWWSLAPLVTALTICFIYRSLLFHTPMFVAFLVLGVVPLAWWAPRLSRFTVRKVLEPRRQELQALLASLEAGS